MFIQTEATPNPATLKFLPGKPVLPGGTRDYRTAEEAAESPLAARLFSVNGVAGIFLGQDFITVTRGEAEWQHLKPAILGLIMDHYLSGAPVLLATSGGDGARRKNSSMRPMGRSSPPSSSCSTAGCARRWRRTAATSPSMASAMALSIST